MIHIEERLLKRTAVVLLTLAALACRASAVETATFRFSVASRGDASPTASVTVATEEKQTIFVITDPFGIGHATGFLTSGQWPKFVSLHLRYDKKRGFRSLENLTIHTARLWIEGEMSSSGKMPFFLPDADGNFDTRRSAAGDIKVFVQQRSDAIEVTLPRDLFVGSKQVTFGWIDAYR